MLGVDVSIGRIEAVGILNIAELAGNSVSGFLSNKISTCIGKRDVTIFAPEEPLGMDVACVLHLNLIRRESCRSVSIETLSILNETKEVISGMNPLQIPALLSHISMAATPTVLVLGYAGVGSELFRSVGNRFLDDTFLSVSTSRVKKGQWIEFQERGCFSIMTGTSVI